MNTSKPNKLTARFSRVLSSLVGLANAPVIITDAVNKPPARVLNFSGMNGSTRKAVFFHMKRSGFITMPDEI